MDLRNPHARRLYESLCRHAGERCAADTAGSLSLPEKPSPAQKILWMRTVFGMMEERLDREILRAVRMDCACGPGRTRMESLKKQYDRYGTLESVAEKLSGMGAPSWTEGGALYMSYGKCYCPFVKSLKETLPESWCDCTLGYSRRLLGYALGCEVESELLESVKRGDPRCLVKISKPLC